MAADRLRVLLIAGLTPWPPVGGARSKLFYLLREQARRHEIDLLLFPPVEPDKGDLTALAAHCRRLEVHHVPLPDSAVVKMRGTLLNHLPLPVNWYLGGRVREIVSRRLQQDAYDLIHLEGYFLGHCLVGLETPPRLIVPHDAHWWNYLENLRLTRGSRGPLLALELAKVLLHEPRLYNAYDAVSMCTELDARALSARCGAVRFGVVSNGVALEEQIPKESLEEYPSLVFSGSYDYPPNEEAALRLLEAIAPALRRRLPRLKVFIVGNVPTPRLVEHGRRDRRNVISGRVPVVADWIARGSVYCSPLAHGTGFKNKVPEAWAMKRPLVATPKTMEGIHFVPGRDALVAETDEGLTAACLRLLTDADLRRSLGEAGRRRVEEEYNWPALADDLETLYRYTAARPRRTW